MKKLKILGMAIGIILFLATSGCFVSQSSYDKLQADCDELQQEITALQNENGSLTTEVESLTSEIVELNSKYPPRHFNSYDELREWVDSHCPVRYDDYTMGFSQYLELQQAALADGYIWSVSIVPRDVYSSLGGYIDEKGELRIGLHNEVEYEVRSCVAVGNGVDIYNIYGVWADGYIEDWGPDAINEESLSMLRNPDMPTLSKTLSFSD